MGEECYFWTQWQLKNYTTPLLVKDKKSKQYILYFKKEENFVKNHSTTMSLTYGHTVMK